MPTREKGTLFYQSLSRSPVQYPGRFLADGLGAAVHYYRHANDHGRARKDKVPPILATVRTTFTSSCCAVEKTTGDVSKFLCATVTYRILQTARVDRGRHAVAVVHQGARDEAVRLPRVLPQGPNGEGDVYKYWRRCRKCDRRRLLTVVRVHDWCSV